MRAGITTRKASVVRTLRKKQRQRTYANTKVYETIVSVSRSACNERELQRSLLNRKLGQHTICCSTLKHREREVSIESKGKFGMLTEQKTSSVCLEYHQRSIYSRHATLNRSKSSKRMHPNKMHVTVLGAHEQRHVEIRKSC